MRTCGCVAKDEAQYMCGCYCHMGPLNGCTVISLPAPPPAVEASGDAYYVRTEREVKDAVDAAYARGLADGRRGGYERGLVDAERGVVSAQSFVTVREQAMADAAEAIAAWLAEMGAIFSREQPAIATAYMSRARDICEYPEWWRVHLKRTP